MTTQQMEIWTSETYSYLTFVILDSEFTGTVITADLSCEEAGKVNYTAASTSICLGSAKRKITSTTAGKVTLKDGKVSALSREDTFLFPSPPSGSYDIDFDGCSGTVVANDMPGQPLSTYDLSSFKGKIICIPGYIREIIEFTSGNVTTSSYFGCSIMGVGFNGKVSVTASTINDKTVYNATLKDVSNTAGFWGTRDPFNVAGTSGTDTFTSVGYCGNSPTTISAGAGNDRIELAVGQSLVSIDGGAGDDTVTFTNDRLNAVHANSTILGGAGNDLLDFRGATDKSSSLYIDGGDDDDDIRMSIITEDGPSQGASSIINSTIKGGAGRDTIESYDASNLLYGGAGADVFRLGDASSRANVQDYAFGEDMFAVGGTDVVKTANSYKPLLRSSGNTGFIDSLAGSNGTATITSSNSFFAVTMMDKNRQKANVGWVGENATKIDASGQTISSVIYGTTNTEGDILIGGDKADTIYAGAGDSVYGGAGRDSINMAANTYGVYVGFSTTGGSDTVDNFTAGWDIDRADAVQMLDGTAESLKVINNGAGKEVSLKSGVATLTLNKAGNATEANILISGKLVDAIAEGQEAVVTDGSTIADYYIGTEASGINMEAFNGDVMVDLSSEMFRNINTLKAGMGNMSVLGSKAAESLIGGKGETSLYGGAGTDTLVSGDGKTTFFANESSGKDVVTGFVTGTGTNSDVINVNALKSLSRSDNTNFFINLDGTNSLKVSQKSGDFDSNIQWASGEAKGVAKIGKINEANNFSYDDATTNYVGSTKTDTVSLASGTSDSFTVWFDQTGNAFSSIEVYDFSQTIGDVLAAGKADTTETIVGGRGSSSLWGGAGNTKDVIVNKDSSAITEFFYGMGDGNDVIEGQRGDSVKLYNLSLSDITKATVNSNNVVFTTTAKNTVTVSGGVGTFKLADGTAWTADYSNKSWTQK